MFREKRFRIRNIDEARQIYPHVESVFLIDGNATALKTAFLLKILGKITATFPECSKIALYAGFNDLRRKSVEDLSQLKRAGLTLAYTGLESGDPVTLERVRKGLTPEQAGKGMAKAKAAGMDILVSIILVKYAFDEDAFSFTVLTGSSQILLLKKIRESLAGRAFFYELWPLMPCELLQKATDSAASSSVPLIDAFFSWLGGLLIHPGKAIEPIAEPDIWAVPSHRLFQPA